MISSRIWFASILILGTSLAGCREPVELSPIELDAGGVVPAINYADLDQVLKHVVDDAGKVNCELLKQDQPRLDAQLRLLSVAGPTQTPHLLATPEARLAYWYNARAAWAMKILLANDCPEKFDRMEDLYDRPFRLDGRKMSLAAIDCELSADSDWRVLAVAPDVCFQRAGLPRYAISGDGFRQLVAWRFNQYVDDPSRFTIDWEKGELIVPPVLWAMRDAITQSYDRAYGTREAKLQVALLPYLEGSPLRNLRDTLGMKLVPMRQPPLNVALVKKD